MSITAKAAPSSTLLTPKNHSLILIDLQAQMAFATHSIDEVSLRDHAGLIARAAASFKVPTILTTVAEGVFAGPMFAEVTDPFPGQDLIDRTSLNIWEDRTVIDQVNVIGRSRLVFAGLWTSVCVVGATLSALEQSFDVYVITDACGDVSVEAHDRAIDRMLQSGARPMTALQYLLELQRDWGRGETYESTTQIAKVYGKSYGLGLIYDNGCSTGMSADLSVRHHGPGPAA